MSICECCIAPMQSILQQLTGQVVILPTLSDLPMTTPFLFEVEITSVNNFLVTVNKPNPPSPGNYIVSIFDVIGVAFQEGFPIVLPPRSLSEDDGICTCKQLPLGNLFTGLIGQCVQIEVSNGLTTPPSTVTGVGEGVISIIIPSNPAPARAVVISLCKITAVTVLSPEACTD